MKETFGDRIKNARISRGLSQAELAERVGISRAAISQIESGETKGMRPENLIAAADALKIEVRELVLGEGQRETKNSVQEISAVYESTNSYLSKKLTDAIRDGRLTDRDQKIIETIIDTAPAKTRGPAHLAPGSIDVEDDDDGESSRMKRRK